MSVDLEEVDALRMLPCLNQDALIACLKEELPVYLVAAVDGVISEKVRRLAWWKQQTRIPTWQHVAKIIFALPHHLAPAERAFSLLKALFSHIQGSVLADQMEAALMLSIIADVVESKKSFNDEFHELTRSETFSEGKRIVKQHGLKALV